MTIPPSTIIVLCTGRCGSMTLHAACTHLTNYSAGHEGRTHLTGADRFAFGPRHIEIDNRLAWMLGRLDEAWGDRATYVHLTRNPEAVARSFAARGHQGILKAYRTEILSRSRHRSRDVPMLEFCRDYVETVTQNICLFLRDKTFTMRMRLETIETDFSAFAEWIGAEGDMEAAQAELVIPHNATRTRA